MFDSARGYPSTAPRPYSPALLGIIALRQHDLAAARSAFASAIAQAGQLLAVTPELYGAYDATGFACCGLALCGDRTRLDDARRAFEKARSISAHAGVVLGVVQLFDALAQADSEGILAAVRPSVAGSS
jgi:hypothetical protein